jgi:hypothetical protein
MGLNSVGWSADVSDAFLRLSSTDDSNRASNSKCIVRNTVEHQLLLQPTAQTMPENWISFPPRFHRDPKIEQANVSRKHCVWASSSRTAEELPPLASKAERQRLQLELDSAPTRLLRSFSSCIASGTGIEDRAVAAPA